MVRQAVQDHYDKEVSQKHAILMRQIKRHQAQAERHVQQLAAKRQAELQALSETARQQSMVLPPAPELDTLLEGLESDDQQQVQQFSARTYRQYLLQLQQEMQHSRSFSQTLPAVRTSSAAAAVPAARPSSRAAVLPTGRASSAAAAGEVDSVMIDLLEVIGEIHPAYEAGSSSGSRCSSPTSRVSRSHRQQRVGDVELQQPLLEGFGTEYYGEQQQQQQQHGGYQAPAVLQQQPITSHQQQQGEEVVIDIQPLHSSSLMHSGSQLLLQRYLEASQPSTAAVQTAAAADKGQQVTAGVGVLQPTLSDVSSAGTDTRTTSSSCTADHSSSGHRNSISSSTVATPDSRHSRRAAEERTEDGNSPQCNEAVSKVSADVVVNVEQVVSS